MNTIHITYPLMAEQLPAHFTASEQIVAIGAFDGVHLGHQNVIGRAKKLAEKLGLPLSVLTFHPHPKEVLGQLKYANYLTPLADKLAIFAEIGIDNACIFKFDEVLAQVSPDQFVQRILLALRAHTVIVGFDFTFGHRGEGTPEMLQSLGAGRFDVEVVPPFYDGEHKVSSSLIREHLKAGDVLRANALLGRTYRISGSIVHGNARGRTIGFPTANIALNAPYVLPRNGVYAVHASVNGMQHSGVMNLGVKPTFKDEPLLPIPEVHLFDFNGSIYDQEMTVELHAFLREERKFASIDELIAQIRLDAAQARSLTIDASHAKHG